MKETRYGGCEEPSNYLQVDRQQDTSDTAD